jgi:hypothetical protein
MLYPMMLLGIGFLTASLLMAMLAPLIHERAVRLTVRRLSAKRRGAVIDKRAHADQLRAQFAVSTLRLETAMQDTQAKAASQFRDAAKKSADIHRLNTELRKANIVILRFQARELTRRSVTRTIVRLLARLYDRAQRQSARQSVGPAVRRRAVPKSRLGAVSA